MIQEERVRYMTRLAIYDENRSKINKKQMQYHRRDYMAFEMIKSFFCGSAVFVLVALLIGIYLTESGMKGIATSDFFRLLLLLFVIYMIFMVLFLVSTYHIYSARYEKGRRESREYYNILKKVNELYEQEEIEKTSEEEF
ncbi:MAG: hypothetical protein HFI37_02685 [Lachnospiraceae bacterium]|nr:hypothetical protein [Lachnospiraceae bacterium]